jgi:hypothetical protein
MVEWLSFAKETKIFDEQIRNEEITIGTEITQISTEKIRREIIITNTSDSAIVTISFGAPTGAGIILYPHYVYSNDFAPSYEKIFAKSDTANTKIHIFER